MDNTISEDLIQKRIFIARRSQLEGRLDPIFYSSDLTKFLKKYTPVRLASVCLSFKSGIGAGKDVQSNAEEGIIQIRPTNIDNEGFLKFEKNIYVPWTEQTDLLEPDTVLFNNTNSQELVGKTAILKDNIAFTYSNHITAICVDKDQILPEYLWIILNLYQQNKIFYSICTNWNNQSGVGVDVLKSLKIPLPDKSVQQVIVNSFCISYKINKIKEFREKILLGKLDYYFLNQLGISCEKFTANRYGMFNLMRGPLNNKIFEISHNALIKRYDPFYFLPVYEKIKGLIESSIYPCKTLKSISSLIQSGKAPKIFYKLGYHYLKVRNIKDCDIDWNTDKIAKDDIDLDHLLNKGDLLLVTMGAGSLGKAVIFENEIKCQFDPKITRFQFKEDINNYFVLYFIRTNLFQKYLEKEIKGSTGMTILSPVDVGNLLIPVPPLKKQNEIVQHINEIFCKVKKLRQEKVEILNKMKQEIEQILLI